MTPRVYPDAVTRRMVTVSIMAAAIMNALDTTIVNVALPHMQGSVSASQEEITWALTSYIVASAIMTPLSGWLADRFGRKRLLLVSVFGFTVASVLCGISTNLGELVIFRLIQGMAGAALMPMSQSILLDINPPEKHAQAMAIFGMGAVLGPIVGPVIGGWLTDNLSWRWCFFINVPVGIVTFVGMLTFLPEAKSEHRKKFDLFGFLMLALGIGLLQLMLDRGQQQDWFTSTEICVEAALSVFFLYAFVVHLLTTPDSFVSLALFRDFNYLCGTFFSFFIGVGLFAVIALLPTMLEHIMGYPVMMTGMIMAPRGIGSLAGMMTIGFLMRFVDMRILVMIGFGCVATAVFMMSGFSLQMDSRIVVISGVINGIGNGIAFVPLTTIAFSTLAPALRNEAAAMFTLIRSIGSAVGISALSVMTYRSAAAAHSRLIEGIRPDNPALALRMPDFDGNAPAAVAAINGEITRQATMISQVDAYTTLGLLLFAIIPLVLFMKPPKPGAKGPTVHVE